MSLIAAVLLVVAAPAAGAAEPTGDPSADDYSPWVWINAWGDASARSTMPAPVTSPRACSTRGWSWPRCRTSSTRSPRQTRRSWTPPGTAAACCN